MGHTCTKIESAGGIVATMLCIPPWDWPLQFRCWGLGWDLHWKDLHWKDLLGDN